MATMEYQDEVTSTRRPKSFSGRKGGKRGERRNAKGAKTSGTDVKPGRTNKTGGARASTQHAATTGETRTHGPGSQQKGKETQRLLEN